MEKKETVAKLRIPLSEGADIEANPKNNAFINLICSYKKGKNLPHRSDLRISVVVEGMIYKGPIKKNDLKKLMDFILLFGDDFDRSTSRFDLLNKKLFKFLKFKKSEKKKKGEGEEKNV
jgi:hypothetical protein